MISKVYSIAINWLNSELIEVEVDVSNWITAFTIVWLPDQWVQESKERIRTALKSSSFKLPTTRITVNLAPADIKKSWPSFDLPIAIWILLQGWLIKEDLIKDSIFLGELSLDWKLRKVSWVLPAVIWAREKWFKRIFLPKDNILEASIIPWIDIIEVNNLDDLCKSLNLSINLKISKHIDCFWLNNEHDPKNDFKYILWQNFAKRAMEIAAAWAHNIIMDWPPWSWKTMLSKAFSSILPKMSIEEVIEVSKIYSVSWLLSSKNPIINKRPFRTIHHTASRVSIIWWWRNAKPWEISLAHRWVLFLDEVLEFDKSVLEVLRQPIEDWEITVTRVNGSYNYPAKFILLWAMNPCPCWYLTDEDKVCTCSKKQIVSYRNRLSWPLIDRIDIFIDIPKVKTNDLKINNDYSSIESSSDILLRVEKAIVIQKERFKGTNIKFNSEMWTAEINKFCQLTWDWDKILKKAVENMNLSARAYYRILKLSRTIADLSWDKDILVNHIMEALSFRKKED